MGVGRYCRCDRTDNGAYLGMDSLEKSHTRVSAVEAIRQSMDVRTGNKPTKTSRLTYKLFGLPGVIAGKYYRRSRKRYRATVVSLFMSIVLFISASAFTDYL